MSLSSPASKPDSGYSVAGKKATDIEYYVAIALERLGIHFIFQYSIGGGRTSRGGIVLDFLALTSPLSTPIDVRGNWWHRPQQRLDDDLGLALAMSRGRYAEPVVLYGSQLQTIEATYSVVKRELRL